MSIKVIQFQEEAAAVQFLDLAFKEKWPARSLLDDKFALTEEQVERIRLEGIPFREVHSNGIPSRHDKANPEQ